MRISDWSSDVCSSDLQEQGVHRPLEADVQVCNFTLGQGDDLHAGKGHALVHAGDVLLVTADAIERFRQPDIEATPLRILPQDLHPGADTAGAGAGTVVAALHHGPAFSPGVIDRPSAV